MAKYPIGIGDFKYAIDNEDGTVNGRSLPASDYRFRAMDSANNEVSGHFSLKR